jgi:hypothetical protein
MAYYLTYQYTWVLYLAAALGMYFCVVKFTKYWKSDDLRSYSRMMSAVILFTPATHSMDGNFSLAPAFIVSFGELLTNGAKAAMQGFVPLMLALFLGAFILTVQAFWNSRKVKA